MMSRKLSYLALAFTSIVVTSACSEKDDHDTTDADFNSAIIFNDYGTYGRTVYFKDINDELWCYYDLMTISNPETVTLTLSSPIKGSCSTNQDLTTVSYDLTIVGESRSDNKETHITTIIEDDIRYRGVYSAGVYQQTSEVNNPLIFFKPFNSDVLVSLRLIKKNEELFANHVFFSDYIMPSPTELQARVDRGNVQTIEEAEELYAVFMILEGYLDHMRYQEPYPVTETDYFPHSVVNRHNIYTDYAYQKLSPSEGDPYPLNQIRVE